jgi:hypothetical protein
MSQTIDARKRTILQNRKYREMKKKIVPERKLSKKGIRPSFL